jgi:hypothetical protein
MTMPRRVRAGMTAFVTRRTLRRHFVLRPDSVFNETCIESWRYA